jgi:hypothetical protein
MVGQMLTSGRPTTNVGVAPLAVTKQAISAFGMRGRGTMLRIMVFEEPNSVKLRLEDNLRDQTVLLLSVATVRMPDKLRVAF